jgi:hypothetical protein
MEALAAEVARYLLTRLCLPFMSEINHLADVVLDVRRALHDHVESIAAVRSDGGVRLRPVSGRLTANCLNHHCYCVV